MSFIIPNAFRAGEKAIAEQINENFNYLKQSLEQVNNTLGLRIDDVEAMHNDDVETIKNDVDTISENISNEETILRLGSIVTPDPAEDGQIPTAQIQLQANRVNTASVLANSEIILPALDDSEKYVNCIFEFTLNADCTITLPSNVKWCYGEPPNITADSVSTNRMIFDTTSGGTHWSGYYYLNKLEQD